jgi:hypothetical protein
MTAAQLPTRKTRWMALKLPPNGKPCRNLPLRKKLDGNATLFCRYSKKDPVSVEQAQNNGRYKKFRKYLFVEEESIATLGFEFDI